MATYEIKNGIWIDDADIVNPDEGATCGNDGEAGLYAVHDAGFVVGAAFAANAQDALDEIADADKLDTWKLTEADWADYGYGDPEVDTVGVCHLGNAGDPYDIECLDVLVLAVPPVSWCACLEEVKEASVLTQAANN